MAGPREAGGRAAVKTRNRVFGIWPFRPRQSLSPRRAGNGGAKGYALKGDRSVKTDYSFDKDL